MEETFQLPQCKAENEEDDLPIPESHDDISETVRQISSGDEIFQFFILSGYLPIILMENISNCEL